MSTSPTRATSPPPLHIHLSRPSLATTVATVIGDVDLASESALRDRLLRALHDRTYSLLDVDFAGVGFVDCAGIGALVAVRNATVHEGRSMQISRPQPDVVRVLDLTGLRSVLQAPISSISRALDDPEVKARIGGAGSTPLI